MPLQQPSRHIDWNEWTSHKKKDGRESFSGQLNNLKVSVYERGTKVSGSLARLLYGHNNRFLAQKDVPDALEILSESLGMQMTNARVIRLDFGFNIFTELPPKHYNQYLGECPFFTRVTYKDTLYYQNSNRALTLYDKAKEIRDKNKTDRRNESGPIEWNEQNVMRIEYRLKRQLDRQLKRDNTAGHLLSDQTLYPELTRDLVHTYQSIRKIDPFMSYSFNDVSSPDELIIRLALLHIENNGGPNTIPLIIAGIKARKQFTRPEYYTRAKKRLYGLYKNTGSNNSSLIAELTRKVESVL